MTIHTYIHSNQPFCGENSDRPQYVRACTSLRKMIFLGSHSAKKRPSYIQRPNEKLPTNQRAPRFQKSCSTIGVGDTTISSPGWSSKQPLPGIGLLDPLHGRQACLEFTSFHQEVGQTCPREGLFSCRPLPKRGQIATSPTPPIVERLKNGQTRRRLPIEPPGSNTRVCLDYVSMMFHQKGAASWLFIYQKLLSYEAY